ncbi:Saposin B-type domain-containing protein [Caenorhabditis elegans]|uniref:Saposin B-type domain-containing protein n=1 Tax=Caenorhabditis elegans TaxID=6239 RepID=Q18276_CAEEL|nr:Saposin B-type domain-containing protein [Caenorhabditis elegans]CCD64009.1 Saposin B-type domain-containing protein [Caenorhabditis elegans]|eukprot:NP_741465.1 SaPosin-like Protein family [Caenorhabditis elegans]
MKYFILTLAVLGSTLAYSKQNMLDTNRVQAEVIENSSCEECENVIKRISEAAKDPKKIEELKIVLGMMCRETSYADECRLFVSQLDKFIDKLQPFLKNPHAVCTRLHICSNKKIDSFRRILLEFAKRAQKTFDAPAIVCDECQFVVKELKTVVEDKKSQAEARDFLRENVCKSLGQYRGFCDLVVDEYLPQFIQELDAILQDPHQVCVDIKACNSASAQGLKARKYVEASNEEKEKVENEVDAFWNGAAMKNNKGQTLAMSCFECKFVVEDMQTDMITNRKKLSDDVRDFACYKIVTANMTDSCIDFLDLYLPTVIQMTVEQATPQGVCLANKCCPASSVAPLRDFTFQEIQAEKCPKMMELETYLSSNLVGSAMEKFFENSLTETFCSGLLSFFQPSCQQIMSSVAPRFVSLTAVLASQNKFSQAMNC